MKYVMFAKPFPKGDLVQFMPVVFPDNLVHADVAAALKPLLGDPVSAGDVTILGANVSGKSSTLNLKSHPKDGVMLRMCDYGFGIQDKAELSRRKRK